MAFRIERNEAANCITFHGATVPVYFNACLSAEVDSEDASRINVINDIQTASSPTDVYAFYKIPYTDFVDADGNPFASAADAAAYITGAGNVLASTELVASTTSVLSNQNASVYADGNAATANPDGESGWYYTNGNTAPGKINWYYVANLNPENEMTKATLKGMYVIIDSAQVESPYFSVYTRAEGDGNDAASWYRSRMTYYTPAALTGNTDTQVLLYWGDDPTDVAPELPRVELTLDAATSSGPQADTENILFAALSTSSGVSLGTYEFTAKQMGYTNRSHTRTYLLDAATVSTTVPTTDVGADEVLDFETDDTNTTVLVDNGDYFPVNAIIAVEENGQITIKELGDNGEDILTGINHQNVRITGSSPATTLSGVVNALNALFTVNALGAGGGAATVLPTLSGTTATLTMREGKTPTTGTPTHLYTTDTDLSSGHGARVWSTDTIDQSGEYFTVKVTGGTGARFILGLVEDGSADFDELAVDSGNAHSGLLWGQAFYDYGSYTAPWTIYGSSTGLSYGAGWNGATTSMMRYNTTVQTDLDNLGAVLFKVGIDAQGYIACWYYDANRSNDWILCSRRNVTTGAGDYKLVVKLWSGNATLVEAPEVHLLDPVAPTLSYRYIESPDGTFHYPLFATEAEAEHVDTENGGGGTATQHVFIDEPTSATWYAPSTGYTSTGTAAPADTGSITYTEIPTNADNLYVPAAYTDNTVTVDEFASVNLQIFPVDANYATTISGQPAGLALSGNAITGTAPEVTGDNVSNPSDDYTIVVTRTNAFGSSTGTLTLRVNNLTAPATAVSGFTWDAASTALVDADTMADGSVVTFDNTLDYPRRYIFEKAWVEANVLPALVDVGDEVWLGVKDGAGVITSGTVEAADWDAYIKWEKTSGSAHDSVIGADTTSTQTVNSLTDAFYDYAFEADDNGKLHVIACHVNAINSGPGVDYGGDFSRTVETTGTSPFTLSMVTVGCEMDLSTTDVSEIVIPQAPRWIQVRHVGGAGHQLEFKQTGDTAFSTTMPTLQAGYTYRFLVGDNYWVDQTTNTQIASHDILRFTADGSTEYTVGITRTGTPGVNGSYVDFAVPTGVPPLSWYNDAEGIGAATGISISGSTYVTPVTGVTQEGPVANQTGTNLFDVGDHGWISVDEQLGAGERLVLDGTFLSDLVSAMPDDSDMYIGLKDASWTDAYSTAGLEGSIYLYIARYSSSDVRVRLGGSVGSTSTLFTTAAAMSGFGAFIDLTGSGNNIRMGLTYSGDGSSDDEGTTAYADWGTSRKLQTGDQGYGLTNVDVMFMGSGNLAGNAAGMDTADVDWTGLSEISVPTPAATLTTPWTKALDFSGSSERTQQVDSGNNYTPIKMGGTNNNVPEHSTQGPAYTSDDSNSRPWATTIVFNADGNSSNQHIWNCGEGSGSTDDNIYLRMDASRNLYFGWGRSGELNEIQFGFNLSTSQWYGVYIASTGERLGSGHAAGDIADCFDIRFVDLSTGSVGSNLSTYANWSALGSSFGARMNRQLTGGMTIGGRGANRNFHGKVAAMVVTTLRRGQQMPQDAEISMMVRDPQQWMTDYKVGVNYRSPSSGSSLVNWQKNSSTPAYSTQVWLMGDGANDAYAQIRNNVYPAIQNIYPMNMISMVSSDIQTVSINGLT